MARIVARAAPADCLTRPGVRRYGGPMTLYLAWRALKYLGLGLLSVGAIAPAFVRHRQDRATLYKLAVVGWLLTWIAGYALVKSKGTSLAEPWVTAGMVWSAIAVTASLLSVHRPVFAGLGAGSMVAGLIPMLFRELALPWMVLAALPGTMVAWFGSRVDSIGEAGSSWSWFRMLAWAEGISLILLLFVDVPARRVFDIELDGGQGWFGWSHGMLFIAYAVALGRWVVERHPDNGARAKAYALGFVAAVLPLGTFVYERYTAPDPG